MAFPTTIFGKLKDVYKTSATKVLPLGTRMVLPDGRVFRYAKNDSTELAKGKLCATCSQNAGDVIDMVLDAAIPVGDVSTVGVDKVSSVDWAADDFKEGYLYVNDAAGEGQIWQVKASAACGTSSGAAATITVEPESYCVTALTSSASKMGIVKNIYDDVRVKPALDGDTLLGVPVGVPIVTIAASRYFWIQTWGPCPVLTVGTLRVAEQAGIGTSTSGAVGAMGPTTGEAASYGRTIVLEATTDYSLIFLTIAP